MNLSLKIVQGTILLQIFFIYTESQMVQSFDLPNLPVCQIVELIIELEHTNYLLKVKISPQS